MTAERRKAKPSEGGTPLFPDLPQSSPPEQKIKQTQHPVWTENKARLISRYLYYFVLVTKHGSYIDGFAGPHKRSKPETWAAKLVLESEPRWLRKFFLFEQDPEKVKLLGDLVDEQPQKPKRVIEVYPGDSNAGIRKLLDSGRITQKEATFCLLDQFTFECEWNTVRALASYKQSPANKIELFYFLANGWLPRAFKGTKTPEGKERIAAWWGGPNWDRLLTMNAWERADAFATRFRAELGYKSAKPWPIYARKSGGVIMYFMIHATDHPEAPMLMARAYTKAVDPREPLEQLALDMGGIPKGST
jgi:three-Cys-motif partner protein